MDDSVLLSANIAFPSSPNMHYHHQSCLHSLRARILNLESLLGLSFDTAPSPGKEAEESGCSKCSPCKPDEGGIGLGLSAAVDAIDVGVDTILAIHTTIDNVVVREMSAH